MTAVSKETAIGEKEKIEVSFVPVCGFLKKEDISFTVSNFQQLKLRGSFIFY